MKKYYALVLCILFAVVVQASPTNSNFEVKIAVIDVQSILESSVATKGIRKSVDTISQDIQNEMVKKETELKSIEESLLKKRDNLKDEDFEKEVENFGKIVSAAQKDVQSRKNRLEQAHADAIAKVHETTISIIGDLSKKHGFNLVLPSSQVLFASNSLNITQEVIKLLNDKLQVVKVDYK